MQEFSLISRSMNCVWHDSKVPTQVSADVHGFNLHLLAHALRPHRLAHRIHTTQEKSSRRGAEWLSYEAESLL